MNASNRRRTGSVIVLLIGLALGVPAADAATVTRGPYLQMGSPTQVVVRWRTDVATDSRVNYGPCFGQQACLIWEVFDSTPTTEHEVTLSGLSPDTRYYYAVGSTTQVLAGNDDSHFFLTSPTTGLSKPTRIWVLGDSGTANSSAAAVRDAYYNFTGSRHTDLWLMLGDNAYSSGTDSEYQAAVFNMYPGMLRKSVLWPTLGNHDGSSANSGTQSGPYYNIFSLPKNGEAGGLRSGTEAYYSFDYGKIHFVVLDSFDSDRSPDGPMMTWLRNDLAATTQDWLIAFWHHPPYSKGSHDSDSESALTDMRRNALPILEDHGVDLVLSGHSHSYERSFLLDRHYGTSNTLSPEMILDGGDGREAGDGAYEKVSGLVPHKGAVYAVAGSSGKTSSGSLNHPVMVISMSVLGSVVLDVDGNRLDATFLRSSGTVGDTFTIMKGSGSGNTPPTAAADSFVTYEDTSVEMAVLSNDADADGDSLSVASFTQPANGIATIANGRVTYTPHNNFNGSDSFAYTVSDGRGGRSIGTVSVTVNPVNDPPLATGREVTTPKETPVSILLTASDPEGDELTYEIIPNSGPWNGTLSGTGANRTYTPKAGWVGTDSFTFKAVDQGQLASTAAVSITVTSGPTITGFQSPTANAPVTSSAGDRNGFESNRTSAYADDGLFAVDTNSGSSSSSSCTSSSKDKHLFYDYNLSIPTSSVIKGIEVRLDARVDSTSGSPRLCVQLSWNGGSSWTTAKTTATLKTSEASYVLGTASDLWGRSWTAGNFGNSSFRIRVISVASSTSRDFSLDWVAVRVTHQPPP